MKKLVVLGSTGSIGRQTLDIARAFPDVFQVVGLAAGNNVGLLQTQIQEFHPEMVYCAAGQQLQLPAGAQWVSMEEMTSRDDVDLVMAATIGTAGLLPTFRALECGKPVALANKEVIVMAGELLKATEKRYGGAILPVDSEPSAIWQCMQGEPSALKRIIITASGGPFRTTDVSELESVTPEQALKHPTWQMGRKITVDSATLTNKAFEVIESRWLFGLPFEKIEVVVHPQSVVHSMIELEDNSIKAQMGPPDMRLPIQYSMFHPDRMPNDLIPRLDIANPYNLTFQPLELERYPCFSLALDAGKSGGTYPAALSAADEVAVSLFLDRKIGYMDIGRVMEGVLDDHDASYSADLEELVQVDQWARTRATEIAQALA